MKRRRIKRQRARRIKAALLKQPLSLDARALDELLAAIELGEPNERPRSRMRIAGGVAVIPIRGILQPRDNLLTRFFGGTSTERLEQDYQAAVGNDQVREVLFYVDSPGGSAMGNEEAARVIARLRDRKPTRAFVRGYCASAAYYLASAVGSRTTDGRPALVATPSSAIGCVGTLLYHEDISGFLDEVGIKVTPFTHGRHKADGNEFEPLSDQSRQTLQQWVEAFGVQFVAAVARHRGVSEQTVMDRFGQGRAYLAQAALERGMIDAVVDDTQALFSGAGSGQDVEALLAAAGGEDAAGGLQIAATTLLAADPGRDSESEPGAEGRARTSNRGESTMNKRIKAALYALGMIDDVNASDETCQAVLNGYFRGNVPESDEQILAALSGRSEPAGEPTGDAGEGGDGDPQAQARAAQEAVRADRRRRAEIEAAGQQLGVSAEAIQAAIESDDPFEDVVAGFSRDLAGREPPVDRVDVTGERADRFAADAVDAMLIRCGYDASREPTAEIQRMSAAPLLHFAGECLALGGNRPSPYDDPETIALAALQTAGSRAVVLASGPAHHRPGDFPNLLSALAGKILDQALEIAAPTYPAWTARLSDLADFKPKTIVSMGHFDELDELMDDQDPGSLPIDEESVGWIQAGRYGNKVGLTPVMVANDDLDGWGQALMTLAMAHEHTLNRLCVALLGGNVALLNGNNLFDDTNHANDVTSGGAPSATQMTTMKRKHRRQTGVGGRGTIRTPPRIALVPTEHEEAALQTLAPLVGAMALAAGRAGEGKQAATDANLNTHRGTVDVVVEPELEDYSTDQWYTIADPRVRRTIVHAFQRGYGRGGRRSRWFDPGKKTLYHDIEGRFAAAAASYRGIVRNAGT